MNSLMAEFPVINLKPMKSSFWMGSPWFYVCLTLAVAITIGFCVKKRKTVRKMGSCCGGCWTRCHGRDSDGVERDSPGSTFYCCVNPNQLQPIVYQWWKIFIYIIYSFKNFPALKWSQNFTKSTINQYRKWKNREDRPCIMLKNLWGKKSMKGLNEELSNMVWYAMLLYVMSFEKNKKNKKVSNIWKLNDKNCGFLIII